MYLACVFVYVSLYVYGAYISHNKVSVCIGLIYCGYNGSRKYSLRYRDGAYLHWFRLSIRPALSVLRIDRKGESAAVETEGMPYSRTRDSRFRAHEMRGELGARFATQLDGASHRVFSSWLFAKQRRPHCVGERKTRYR